MSNVDKRKPYQPLGSVLKDLRERNRESVAEVSGAVEIDEKHLSSIEAGDDRPSEDILLLLISHFSVEDDKAAELWQLAGYDTPRADEEPEQRGGSTSRAQTLMVMVDPRVMYSDGVEVVANKQGVILNFGQTTSHPGQPLTVSRIGMSRDQAKTVMGILHQALYELENPTNPRRLPGGTDDNNKLA